MLDKAALSNGGEGGLLLVQSKISSAKALSFVGWELTASSCFDGDSSCESRRRSSSQLHEQPIQ